MLAMTLSEVNDLESCHQISHRENMSRSCNATASSNVTSKSVDVPFTLHTGTHMTRDQHLHIRTQLFLAAVNQHTGRNQETVDHGAYLHINYHCSSSKPDGRIETRTKQTPARCKSQKGLSKYGYRILYWKDAGISDRKTIKHKQENSKTRIHQTPRKSWVCEVTSAGLECLLQDGKLRYQEF